MNAEIFAEWMRRQGHQVIRTESSYWYDAGMRVFQAFPYHWLIQPTPQELRSLLLRHGIVALRYSTPLNAAHGMASYHVVLCNPYNMEMLRHQARSNIRRGLRHCEVERITFERLAKEGWLLQQDTLERQGRSDSMSEQDWSRICLSAQDLPGFEAWAAIVDGGLAATLLTTRIDDTCYVPYAQCHHKYLKMRVNNALFYVVNCDMLSREGVSEIFFCLHSLDAPESVNEFKFRMSFVPKPVRQRIVFNPLCMPLVNQTSHKIIARLLQRNPDNYILSKAEGMLRFHLKGKQPIEEQDWPYCLESIKEDFLNSNEFKKPQPVVEIDRHDRIAEMQVDS